MPDKREGIPRNQKIVATGFNWATITGCTRRRNYYVLNFDIYQLPARDAALLVLLCSEEVDPPALTVVILDLLETWRLFTSIGILASDRSPFSPTSSLGDVWPFLVEPWNRLPSHLAPSVPRGGYDVQIQSAHLSNASVFSHATASNASCHLE